MLSQSVSKGAAQAKNLGQPAPFDTSSTVFRATQDAGVAEHPFTVGLRAQSSFNLGCTGVGCF